MNDKSQYLHVVCNNYKLTKHVWLSECHDTFTYRPPTTNVRWGRNPPSLGTQEREWVTDPLALLRAGRSSGTEMLYLFQHTRWWKRPGTWQILCATTHRYRIPFELTIRKLLTVRNAKSLSVPS